MAQRYGYEKFLRPRGSSPGAAEAGGATFSIPCWHHYDTNFTEEVIFLDLLPTRVT
jgi:hypothetical protein